MVDRQEYVDKLKAQGYRQIGNSSCYAHVFAQPNGDHVIKVGRDGRADDDGWLPFARYVMKNGKTRPSQHFPRIDWIEDHGEWFSARIERLTEVKETDNRSTLLTLQQKTRERLIEGGKDAELPKSLQSVVNRLRYNFDGKWRFDLHSENVMVRGDVLVITDPLANKLAA